MLRIRLAYSVSGGQGVLTSCELVSFFVYISMRLVQVALEVEQEQAPLLYQQQHHRQHHRRLQRKRQQQQQQQVMVQTVHPSQ